MQTIADHRARRINTSVTSREKHPKQEKADILSERKQEELLNEELIEERLSPAAQDLLQYRLQGVATAELAKAESYTFSVVKDDQHFHWGRMLRKLSIRLSNKNELQAWLVTDWQKTTAQLSEQHILYADLGRAEQFYERLAVNNPKGV